MAAGLSVNWSTMVETVVKTPASFWWAMSHLSISEGIGRKERKERKEEERFGCALESSETGRRCRGRRVVLWRLPGAVLGQGSIVLWVWNRIQVRYG
jgi:hypothetical protein